MERKTIWLVGMLTLVLLLAGLGTSLAVVDKTATVPASAVMGSTTTLSVQPKNISNGTDASVVNFGAITELTNKLAPQYVEITVGSNVLGSKGAWGLEIYTDNFTIEPDTTTWGLQYGGMKGSTDGNRVAMAWQAYRTTTSVFDPPVDLVGWTYLKDKWDVNDPGAAPDESWASAHADGYTNIAYGGIDYLMVVEPGTTGELDTDNTFAVYLGGLFGSAAADTYDTVIGFDLYHE